MATRLARNIGSNFFILRDGVRDRDARTASHEPSPPSLSSSSEEEAAADEERVSAAAASPPQQSIFLRTSIAHMGLFSTRPGSLAGSRPLAKRKDSMGEGGEGDAGAEMMVAGEEEGAGDEGTGGR